MKYYLTLAYFLLAACSNLPPAIKDPPAFDLTYNEALTHIAKYKNAPVRWGGTIVQVENEPSFSAIQVLLYPLGSYGQPDLEEPNQGRFVFKSPEFLDPAIYKKDSSVTVAGIVEGDTERTVGNKTLRIPLVAAKHIHLWPGEDYYPYYGGYGGFGYGGFGYGPGFYPYGGFGYYPYYWRGYYRPYPYRTRPYRRR